MPSPFHPLHLPLSLTQWTFPFFHLMATRKMFSFLPILWLDKLSDCRLWLAQRAGRALPCSFQRKDSDCGTCFKQNSTNTPVLWHWHLISDPSTITSHPARTLLPIPNMRSRDGDLAAADRSCLYKIPVILLIALIFTEHRRKRSCWLFDQIISQHCEIFVFCQKAKWKFFHIKNLIINAFLCTTFDLNNS